MKKLIILFFSCALLIAFSGCKQNSKIVTSINNAAEYFTQDNFIQMKNLPWGLSSAETRKFVGEVEEDNLQSYNLQSKLIPIKQITLEEFSLTSKVRCYYFDEQDQLYHVWFCFSFTDKEQVKQKMEEVVEYFQQKFPSSFQYQYNDKSSTVLRDALTLDKFDIPMASWFDETGTQLCITVEPEGEGFHLNIKLASRKGHSLF